jgi:lysophospholipase L1-like esterase
VALSVWGVARFLSVQATRDDFTWGRLAGQERARPLMLPAAQSLTFRLDLSEPGQSARVRMTARPDPFAPFALACRTGQGETRLDIDAAHADLFPPGRATALEVVADTGLLSLVIDGAVWLREPFTLPLTDCALTAGASPIVLTQAHVLVDPDIAATSAADLGALLGPAFAFLLGALLLYALELGWLARRFGVDRWRAALSVQLSLAALAVWLGMTAGHAWLMGATCLVVFLILYAKVRFWLLAANYASTPSVSRKRFWLGVVLLPFVPLATYGALITADFGKSAALAAAAGVTVAVLTLILAHARGRGWKLSESLAVFGPLLLPWLLLAFLVTQIEPVARGAVLRLLPFGAALLAVPLIAGRRELRWYGALRLLAFAVLVLAIDAALWASPSASRLQPLGMGTTFEPHPDLFWAPKQLFGYEPDFAERDDLRVTRLHFRGDENAPLAKPAGEFRILVAGGSNTWGDGRPSAATTWANLLEKRLAAGGAPVNVLNAGAKGYNLFQVMVLVTQYGLAYDPDLVLLYVTRNDAADNQGLYTFRELLEKRRAGQTPWVARVQGVLRRSAIYNALTLLARPGDDPAAPKWYRPELWKSANPPEDYAANLRDVIAAANARGARVVLVTEFWGEHFYDGIEMSRVEKLQGIMREVAAETGSTFIDAWGHFNALPDPRAYLLPHDPVHINAAGHAELARFLAAELAAAGLVSSD